MDKIKQLIRRRINESGAALVTVIVVIGFISIMVTVILYASGMNYYMKGTDKEIKDSFYDAESALELVRADMMIMANDAFQVSYKDTMMRSCELADGDYLTEAYNESFVKAVKEKYTTIMTTKTLNEYYDGVVGHKYSAGLSITDESIALTYNEDAGTIIIKGFKLSYAKDGYNTEIQTDFIIRPPAVEWYANKSQTSLPVGADTSVEFQRKVFDMADCVVYYNWEKR